ncbi:Panacea domain-containing protein [Amorphus sp. MBR-141]
MTDLCPPIDIARWFINRVDREAGEAMTHLKVQKLLYFSQAYYLANFSKPLFEEDFEAWAHGPVITSVFHEYSSNRWEALPAGPAPAIAEEIQDYLEAVYRNFGKFSAKQLERISHNHAPWIKARGGLPEEARCNNIIPKNEIKIFYAERIQKAKKEKKERSVRTGNAS